MIFSTRSTPLLRLSVHYSTLERLLQEWTYNVGRETVALTCRKKVEAGCLFLFSLHHKSLERPIELYAQVLQVTPRNTGLFLLHVHYEAPRHQKLDVVKALLEQAHLREVQRRHLRIPFCLQATEEAPYSPQYWIRDLSVGGARLEIDAPKPSKSLQKGMPCMLRLQFALTHLEVEGQVAWVTPNPKDNQRPAVGLQFSELELDVQLALQPWVNQMIPPPRPWKAWVRFGTSATSAI